MGKIHDAFWFYSSGKGLYGGTDGEKAKTAPKEEYRNFTYNYPYGDSGIF